MNQNMDYRFSHERMPKLIVSLAAPAIAAQIINALYNIVDRMYIGQMPGDGTLALTGVGITFPIIMMVSAFSALIGFGGAPLSSIKLGEGDREGAERILGFCFSMLIGCALVLTVLLLPAQNYLLPLFGASPDTMPYASSYLQIYLTGTISVQLALGMNQFVSAQGFAKTAMFTVCIGAALNILLDPILIFGFGLGVRGAAWATVISQTVSAVWVLSFFFVGRSNLRLRVKNMKFEWKIACNVLGLGMSPFIMQSTTSLVQVAFNSSLAYYGGDLYVGAMVILNSVMQFALMPAMGVAQGAQPIIGYNYGSGDHDRVRSAIRYSTFFCVLFSGVVWTLTVFFPTIPVRMFTSNPELIGLTAQTMRVFFLGILIFGFQIAFQQAFVALGQAKVSIFIAALRKLILLIPLILFLPKLLPSPVWGVIIAEPVADTIAAVTCIILFRLRIRALLHTGNRPADVSES